MKLRYFVLPALLTLLPLASPASAAPACFVLNWSHGDTCRFETPARAYVFGGTATAGEGQTAWIAVEVMLNGVSIESCFGTGFEVATCEGQAQSFTSNVTYTCQVSGTGGPKFHCADPPLLPLPLG